MNESESENIRNGGEQKWIVHKENVPGDSHRMDLIVRDPTTNEVLGRAAVEIHSDLVYLVSLGVTTVQRGQRIGSSLLAEVEQLCEAEGKYGILKKGISVASPFTDI